jgi:hypothetical protein
LTVLHGSISASLQLNSGNRKRIANLRINSLENITPQAGGFMSVFQRVKFPLAWLVKRHYDSSFMTLFLDFGKCFQAK